MGIRFLSDLLEAPKPEWLWKGFLLPSHLTLFSSAPKVGKTTFIFNMLRDMWTEGQECLGYEIRPSPVLYISEEADTRLGTRAEALGFSTEWPIGWVTLEPGRDWSKTLAYMERWAFLYKNPLIILDTLSRHWGVDDENDSAKVEKVINPILTLARTTGLAAMLVHHTRKSGGKGGAASRGSTALTGAVDIVVEFDRVNKDDHTTRRQVECFSRWEDSPERLTIQLQEEGYIVVEGYETEVDMNSPVLTFLMDNPGHWTSAAIAAAAGVAPRTARDTLGALVRSNKVLRTGQGTKSSPHQFEIGDFV